MDKSPQNVGTMRGDILHKYNVSLPGVKPRLHTWVRKHGRLVKSNLGMVGKSGFGRIIGYLAILLTK